MAARSKNRAVQITGMPELLQKLGELKNTRVMDHIAFRATFGAAKDMRELAKQHYLATLPPAPPRHQKASDYSHALEKGFAIKRFKEGSKRGYHVGVRSGNVRPGDIKQTRTSVGDPYYWWFLEFGTRRIAPRRFFQKAFMALERAGSDHIIRAGTKAVLDSGNRALKKYGNGTGKPK